MKKDEYLLLEINEQLELVNNLLAQGQNVTKVADGLGIDRKTITRNFKKISYEYDYITKQYAKTNVSQEQIKDNSPNIDKPKANKKLANRLANEVATDLDHSTTFYIPIKTKLKASTKAFNVVMDKVLADKIDKLAKAKNYSRNQIINYMCEWCLDNNEK